MNANAPRQWQYSLRTFLLVVVLLAVLLGIAIRLPHQAMFIALMTGLLLTSGGITAMSAMADEIR